MEEVDNIILHTLKQIGCDFEEDIQSLKQFNTDVIIEAVVRCLRIVRNDGDYLQLKLPANMSARFRLASSIAQTCQELGYRGEIGYQTLLYSSDSDIRRLFMFLVEKLPKISADAADSKGGRASIINEITAKLAISLALPWLPPHCGTHGARWYGKSQNNWMRESNKDSCVFYSWPVLVPEGVGDVTIDVHAAKRKNYADCLPYVSAQPLRRQDVPASLVAANAADIARENEFDMLNDSNLSVKNANKKSAGRINEKLRTAIADSLRVGLQKGEVTSSSRVSSSDLARVIETFTDKMADSSTKGSRFTRSEKLLFSKDEKQSASQVGATGADIGSISKETQQQQQEEELSTLKNQLEELKASVVSLEEEIKSTTTNKQQLEEAIEGISRSITATEEMYNVKKKTISLLPEADKNIAALKKMIGASSQRLSKLATQWEQHRLPLLNEYRQLKKAIINQEMSETQQKLEDLKIMRQKMKEFADEAKVKDELHKHLLSNFEQINKDINRSAYTQRIMEIVGNIKKQHEDIAKIIEDTKSSQREINLLNGKLERTFAVTDELIFRTAKKDEASKKAYKLLANIHETFSALVIIIEETGVIAREGRDLEDQIEAISQDNTDSSLEQITADYKQMKQENNALETKLKKR